MTQLGEGVATGLVQDEQSKIEAIKAQPKKRTENILFIGSEQHYDLFWLKMMFVGAAHFFANRNMRKADQTVVAYVDSGYVRAEKLAIEGLAQGLDAEVIALDGAEKVSALLGRKRDEFHLLDVAIFSHGLVGSVDLDYNGPYGIRLKSGHFTKVRNDAFAPNGRLLSYACRTGIGESSHLKDKFGFKNDSEAKPEMSLAQAIANHFDIKVYAFLRRSFYGEVLRAKADSESIAALLRAGRAGQEGSVIQIPPEHEALPHLGLASSGADNWFYSYGPKGEGTNDYALWRKKGGRILPTAASTPTGLSSGQRVFCKG